jgi:hypothetical protein
MNAVDLLDLPADFATWSKTRKQSVLLALAKEAIAKEPDGVVIGGDNEPSLFLIGPVNPLVRIELDDSTEELRELRRRIETPHNAVPLDSVIDKLL